MSNQQSFTPQVQDSDRNIRRKNLETDCLPSNSHENQSEDDSESTDDGFDRLTDHQVHLSTPCQ